jgi:hypothetical protein
MATKRSSKATRSSKNRSERIPSIKRLNAVRPLKAAPPSLINCPTREAL